MDHRITMIRDKKIDKLSISLDYDVDPKESYPVFLFIPDVNEFDHYHIPLTKEESKTLFDWLKEYLNDGNWC
jgi:hypothetical protein